MKVKRLRALKFSLFPKQLLSIAQGRWALGFLLF